MNAKININIKLRYEKYKKHRQVHYPKVTTSRINFNNIWIRRLKKSRTFLRAFWIRQTHAIIPSLQINHNKMYNCVCLGSKIKIEQLFEVFVASTLLNSDLRCVTVQHVSDYIELCHFRK